MIRGFVLDFIKGFLGVGLDVKAPPAPVEEADEALLRDALGYKYARDDGYIAKATAPVDAPEPQKQEPTARQHERARARRVEVALRKQLERETLAVVRAESALRRAREWETERAHYETLKARVDDLNKTIKWLKWKAGDQSP